jgi:hypothetical protein
LSHLANNVVLPAFFRYYFLLGIERIYDKNGWHSSHTYDTWK